MTMKLFFNRICATPGVSAGLLGLALKAIPVALPVGNYAAFIAAAVPRAGSAQRYSALKATQ